MKTKASLTLVRQAVYAIGRASEGRTRDNVRDEIGVPSRAILVARIFHLHDKELTPWHAIWRANNGRTIDCVRAMWVVRARPR